MGKQYKKLIKRRRRTAYLARRKTALNAEKPVASNKAKPSAKKSARKKAGPAEKPEPVAEKAKAEDVLGPDVAGEKDATGTEDSGKALDFQE